MKNNGHRRNTEKKKQGKNFNLKTQYCFLEFFQKHNIQHFCDRPKLCYNYLVNPQNLNDGRFSRADQSQQFLSHFQLFLEAVSKFVQFCTKFKLKWVLYLRRNVLVYEYWYCAANHQYSKITGFIKDIKKKYGQKELSLILCDNIKPFSKL